MTCNSCPPSFRYQHTRIDVDARQEVKCARLGVEFPRILRRQIKVDEKVFMFPLFFGFRSPGKIRVSQCAFWAKVGGTKVKGESLPIFEPARLPYKFLPQTTKSISSTSVTDLGPSVPRSVGFDLQHVLSIDTPINLVP